MLRKNSKLLNLKRSSRNCEFCNAKFVSEDDTVCGPCDKALELEYVAKMKTLMAVHSSKYKCQLCGDGLPLSRRVKCESCTHNHPVDFDERYIDCGISDRRTTSDTDDLAAAVVEEEVA